MSSSIAACFITKDEAARIGQAVTAIRPFVDEVCIYDTGSSDRTLAFVRELAADSGTPVRIDDGTWRNDFAWAREQSFALARSDWLLWLDADDEIHGGELLRDLVAAADRGCIKSILALYDSHDRGFVWRDRIVRRGAGRWEGRVHEFLRVPGPFYRRSVSAHPDAFRVRHLRRDQHPGRYLDLVRLATQNPEQTPRAWYLLGKELMAIAAVDQTTARLPAAADALEQYLSARDDRVEGEPNSYRGDALKRLIHIYEHLGWTRDYERVLREGTGYAHQLEEAAEKGLIPDATYFTELGDFTRTWAPSKTPPAELLLEVDPFTDVKGDRNAPCPCGSEKKYKKCHGAIARK